MRLSKLVVKHYKSLMDVELDNIQPITILVGCNGTGKSNVVDVLRFVRDAVDQGIDHAVSTRGGIGLIRQYSPTKPYQISIELCFVDDEFPDAVFRYQLVLKSLKEGNFRIEREEGEWYERDFFPEHGLEEIVQQMHFERKADERVSLKISRKTAESEYIHLYLAPFSPDTLAFGREFLVREGKDGFFRNRIGGSALNKFMLDIRFSSVYPNILRQPAPPDTDLVLKEDGANWSSILRSLRKTSQGKRALEQIREMMQVVMPQLEDITTQVVGGFILPRFKVKEENGDIHFFDPSQISDGTLRILGILIALYQTPHPSLMVIEEPEQTINPALLALLVDAFRGSSKRTQLLITSHSPQLVDLFAPEDIRVVTMQAGNTRVAPIRASQQEVVKEYLFSLGQFMSAEGLLPEDA
jgi:predicted ATPase